MIGVLQLARTYGTAALQRTVAVALTLGCSDQAAVRHLLLTATLDASADRADADWRGAGPL